MPSLRGKAAVKTEFLSPHPPFFRSRGSSSSGCQVVKRIDRAQFSLQHDSLLTESAMENFAVGFGGLESLFGVRACAF